jgi:hypothetical protein
LDETQFQRLGLVNIILQNEGFKHSFCEFSDLTASQNAIDWSMSHKRIITTRPAYFLLVSPENGMFMTAAERAPEMGNPLIRG